ncbi:MAG: tRNA threonylcarbamoyladenosine dehydratase [Clostridiales bacterium]|nr:tRNA threonylcarbamoyladenosine dehydratase [Clostridiales bacterium]
MEKSKESGIFSRTEMLIGKDALEKLNKCRVAVFGVGGVGGYAVEALARSGIGTIDVIDSDVVDISNINRQIIATSKTVGRKKVEVAKERIADINPDSKVNAYDVFYNDETRSLFDFDSYDYVIDAIDSVSSKLDLIVTCKEHNVPVISSMGAGNKLDPTKFEVDDIYKTSVCPLAKVMRRELKKRGVESLKVVYSKEEPITSEQTETPSPGKRSVPGSIAFVPSVVGLIAAGEVIKDLIK